MGKLRGSFAVHAKQARWTLAYVRQHAPRWLTLSIVLALALAALPSIQVLTTRQLINTVVDFNAGSDALVWLSLSVAVAFLTQVLTSGRIYVAQRMRKTLHESITLDILQHSTTLELDIFENPRYQDTFQRVQDNMGEHIANFVDSLILFVTGVLEVAGLIFILVQIDPLILVIVLPLIAIYALYDGLYARRRFREDYDRTTMYRWTGYFSYKLLNYTNVPEVRLLNLAPWLIDQYRALISTILDALQKLDNRKTQLDLLFVGAFLSAFFVTFARVVTRTIEQAITVGDMVVYGQIVLQLRGRLQSLSNTFARAYQETLYTSNLMEYFALQPITAPADPTFAPLRGEIAFHNVSFHYPNAPTPALKEVSFTVQPGEIVAVMGANGAGKSTLVKLLSRLYSPTAGSIEIDGIDLQSIPVAAYHRQVAFMLQNYNLYEGTIHENIAFGDWQRLLNAPDDVRALAVEVGIDEMIQQFPQAYDTKVGLAFHHFNLSVGQWQKLALLRTLAKSAAMLILDEPTASMDAKSEGALFSWLRQGRQNMTTILISHRFSTLRMADRVLVLDDGRLIEQGTHAELLERNGQYAQMYSLYHAL